MRIPGVTSDMLARQRYEFTAVLGPNTIGSPSGQRLAEIRRSSNFYAPDHLTMYSPEDGNQNDLWERRWEDGKWWSAFLAKNIAREFDVLGLEKALYEQEYDL